MGFAAAMHTLTATKKSMTSYGAASTLSAPAYAGAATTFACSVQRNPRRKVMQGGREVDLSFVIQTETEILLTDKVWAPGTDTTNDALGKRPVDVTSQLGFDGVVLYEAGFSQ